MKKAELEALIAAGASAEEVKEEPEETRPAAKSKAAVKSKAFPPRPPELKDAARAELERERAARMQAESRPPLVVVRGPPPPADAPPPPPAKLRPLSARVLRRDSRGRLEEIEFDGPDLEIRARVADRDSYGNLDRISVAVNGQRLLVRVAERDRNHDIRRLSLEARQS